MVFTLRPFGHTLALCSTCDHLVQFSVIRHLLVPLGTGVVKTFRCVTQAIEMDETDLLAIAKSLEAQASEPKSHMGHCNPQHMVGLIANRDGFLRFAALCLRAASAPITNDSELSRPVEPCEQHEQIIAAKNDVMVGFTRRREEWPETNAYIDSLVESRRRSDRFALFGCAAVVILVILGVVFLATW